LSKAASIAFDIGLDAALDKERRAERPTVGVSDLREGAMVACGEGEYFLVHGGGLWRWSFGGYQPPVPPESVGRSFTLLTPLSIVRTLEAGYAVTAPRLALRAA
jgi:hypothetical protein